MKASNKCEKIHFFHGELPRTRNVCDTRHVLGGERKNHKSTLILKTTQPEEGKEVMKVLSNTYQVRTEVKMILSLR